MVDFHTRFRVFAEELLTLEIQSDAEYVTQNCGLTVIQRRALVLEDKQNFQRIYPAYL